MISHGECRYPPAYTQLGRQIILDEELLANSCKSVTVRIRVVRLDTGPAILTRTILGADNRPLPNVLEPPTLMLPPPFGSTLGADLELASWTSDSRCSDVCRPIRLIARGLCSLCISRPAYGQE